MRQWWFQGGRGDHPLRPDRPELVVVDERNGGDGLRHAEILKDFGIWRNPKGFLHFGGILKKVSLLEKS